MTRGALGSAGAVLAMLLAAAPILAQSDEDAVRPEVKKLVIRGVKSVDEDELRKSIATEESHCKSLLFQPFCLVTKSHYVYEREYLTRSELARDLFRIKVFYFQRGWRQTTVDSVVTGNQNGVTVVLEVKEGPPTIVQNITVRRPADILDDRKLGRLMELRAGEPLNLLALDTSRVKIEDTLWDAGYADAIIDADSIVVSEDKSRATVLVTIDPRYQSRIGEIRIAGNRKVAERTIRNSLYLKEGELYRREEVIRSQRALYESGLFKRAQIIVPPQGDTTKLIEISITEAPLRNARLSAGFNTAEFVQVEGLFTNRNWSGGARRLTLSLGVGNLFASGLNNTLFFRDVLADIQGDRSPFTKPTWRASAEVRQPWFMSPRNEAAISAFASRRISPGIFVDNTIGTQATFTREVALRAPTSLTYRFELTRVSASDVYFCVNYGVCDVPTIGALQREQRLSPLALQGTVDRTNDALDPTVGYLARADFEHASRFTISDYRYNRATTDIAVYRRMGGERTILSSHLRLGWVKSLTEGSSSQEDGVTEILHPRKRFYAGGSRSVRGYREGQLGPRILTIPPGKLIERACVMTLPASVICPANALDTPSQTDTSALNDEDFTPRPLGGNTLLEGSVEMRFPIWKNLGGAAFVDGAIVGGGTFRDIASGTGAITPGIGVRYYSPVGPIRVDLGFNPFVSEDLAVLTQVGEGPGSEIVPVRARDANGNPVELIRTYAPAKNRGGFRGFLNQLTLHLSIGHAY
jgi:outer membrane protein insertion porin family/translocation and assembly module TamA